MPRLELTVGAKPNFNGAVPSGELFELSSPKDVQNLLGNAAYSIHRPRTSCTLSFDRATVEAPAISHQPLRVILKELLWTGVVKCALLV